MLNRSNLFLYSLWGGISTGLLVCAVLHVFTGQPETLGGWAAGTLAAFLSVLTSNYWSWHTRHQLDADNRNQWLNRIANGDLLPSQSNRDAQDPIIKRLWLSLRRSLQSIRNVTVELQSGRLKLAEQVGQVLDLAHRQTSVAAQSYQALEGLTQNLDLSQKRLTDLEVITRDISSVGGTLSGRSGELVETFKQFAHSVDAVRQRNETVSTQAAKIAFSQQMLGRHTEETREFAAALGANIVLLCRRSDEASAATLELTTSCEAGEILASGSARAIRRLIEIVKRASEWVERLEKQSQEIGQVVDVIQEVADQTNLLALNASLIANQAGESGKAFGVVAAEVRALSERTAQGTREIFNLVKTIREEVNGAVEWRREGREAADAALEQGDQTANSVREIRGATWRAFTALESAGTESRRTETQSTQIVDSIAKIGERLKEIIALAEEQLAVSQQSLHFTHELSRSSNHVLHVSESQSQIINELSDYIQRLALGVDGLSLSFSKVRKQEATMEMGAGEIKKNPERIAETTDELWRTLEQLRHDTQRLEEEVLQYQLPEPQVGGTLVVAAPIVIKGVPPLVLDPLLATTWQATEYSSAVFDTLLQFQEGMVAPGLAENWESDSTLKQYRLHLRRNVYFHDGVAFEAAHVKTQFERLLDPKVGSTHHSLLKDIEGATAWSRGEAREVSGISVVDPHTLDITLTEPRAYFLHILTAPATAIARRTERGQWVGTGPFSPTGESAAPFALQRNRSHFRTGSPLLSRLEFRVCASPKEALSLLAKGDVQLVPFFNPGQSEVVVSSLNDIQTSSSTSCSTAFLGFHLRHVPFDDVRVRRALRAGMDVRGMVESFYRGAHVARSLTPPVLLEMERFYEPKTDIELARQLLAAAGHPTVRLKIFFSPDRDTRAEDAVLFKPLREAGLVELEHVPVASSEMYWQRVRAGELPIIRGNWTAQFNDPDNFLHHLLNSKAQTTYAWGYNSPEFDRVTQEARTTRDANQRKALYRKAETIVREDCVIIPLFHDCLFALGSAQIQNLKLNSTPSHIRFETLWLLSEG